MKQIAKTQGQIQSKYLRFNLLACLSDRKPSFRSLHRSSISSNCNHTWLQDTDAVLCNKKQLTLKYLSNSLSNLKEKYFYASETLSVCMGNGVIFIWSPGLHDLLDPI